MSKTSFWRLTFVEDVYDKTKVNTIKEIKKGKVK